jgi:hypothetical protein
MSGTYFIRIIEYSIDTVIFSGSFVVDYDYTPNIIAFYEDGNPNNILAPTETWGANDNIFVSKQYPFTNNGTSITTMSTFAGPPPDYGSNTVDNTYNFYSNYSNPASNISLPFIYNFDDTYYTFDIIGGPVYPPFPLDGSIPPVTFYTIQGLPMFLNQNVQYKVYYTDNPQFPYLTVNADVIYPGVFDTYDIESVPLSPLLSNMNTSQLLTYQEQLALFMKVYEHNSNAYITYASSYVSNPETATNGPIYYTFQNYKEMTNYKAGLQLVNRIYPFDIMANAHDQITGVPLRWIVPFPL